MNQTKNPDYLAVAENILSRQFADADCAFVAGSMLRNEATASSDIDLIILYNDTTHESYRQSIMAEGWPVEIFVHNLASQDFFMNGEVKSGECLTATMVSTGIIIGRDNELAEHRKAIACDMIAQGPEEWTTDKVDTERYFITDLWDDLREPKDTDAIPAILSKLMPRLGQFYFRTQKKWSGSGKALVRLLKQDNPDFARKFLDAFDAAYHGDNTPLKELLDTMLAPYGGMLFAEYKSVANGWDKHNG